MAKFVLKIIVFFFYIGRLYAIFPTSKGAYDEGFFFFDWKALGVLACETYLAFLTNPNQELYCDFVT